MSLNRIKMHHVFLSVSFVQSAIFSVYYQFLKFKFRKCFVFELKSFMLLYYLVLDVNGLSWYLLIAAYVDFLNVSFHMFLINRRLWCWWFAIKWCGMLEARKRSMDACNLQLVGKSWAHFSVRGGTGNIFCWVVGRLKLLFSSECS